MSDELETSLSAVLRETSTSDLLAAQDWAAIAAEAVKGNAPAQYIVATSFEKQGDLNSAKEWYQRSAAQQYAPAAVKLAQLKRGSAA